MPTGSHSSSASQSTGGASSCVQAEMTQARPRNSESTLANDVISVVYRTVSLEYREYGYIIIIIIIIITLFTSNLI